MNIKTLVAVIATAALTAGCAVQPQHILPAPLEYPNPYTNLSCGELQEAANRNANELDQLVFRQRKEATGDAIWVIMLGLIGWAIASSSSEPNRENNIALLQARHLNLEEAAGTECKIKQWSMPILSAPSPGPAPTTASRLPGSRPEYCDRMSEITAKRFSECAE